MPAIRDPKIAKFVSPFTVRATMSAFGGEPEDLSLEPKQSIRLRKLDVVDPANDSQMKRNKQEHHMNYMDVDANPATISTVRTESLPNPDEILVQMVTSGSHTRAEVVEFCINSKIPLSRMFRLDLMSQVSKPS
jgi:hypothetical protein